MWKACVVGLCLLSEGKSVDSENNHIIEAVKEFAEPLLEEMHLELVEVLFRCEGHGWVLRFFIDHEQGITIDDCAAVSREVSAYLEVEDIIEHSYHLEVSSPGAERPLKTEKDFLRFAGKKVRIKLRSPLNEQKVFVGILKGAEGENVLLEQDDQKNILKLAMENISKARLVL